MANVEGRRQERQRCREPGTVVERSERGIGLGTLLGGERQEGGLEEWTKSLCPKSTSLDALG